MIRKSIPLVIVALLFISLVSAASFTFRQDQAVDHRHRCYDASNNYCSTGTILQLSIAAPNGTTIIDNSSMSANPTYFNHSLPTNDVGIYSVLINVPANVNQTISEFTYEVTPTGLGFSTGQGITYFGMFAFAVLIFIATLIFAIKIPWKNPRHEDGVTVVGVNDLKYLKLFLWVGAYVIAIWITGLATSITRNFLFFNQAGDFFYVIYWILLSFAFPLIVIFMLTAFVRFVEDKKIKKALRRGLPFR